MTMKEVTLPLHRDMRRCMGAGDRPGEYCPDRDGCARHTTMQHDDEPWEIKPWYRLCSFHGDGAYALKVPVEGYMLEEPEV